jgi:hypothetical protein
MAKSYGFSSLNTNLMATPVWRCAGLFITTFCIALDQWPQLLGRGLEPMAGLDRLFIEAQPMGFSGPLSSINSILRNR